MRLYGYFTFKNYILIILEYVNNRDLKHFMKKYKGLNNLDEFSEVLTAHFVLQILKALGHLKLRNIVHRDIKPENILINSNFVAKLGDFTLARKIDLSETINTSRSGTIPYLSPECVIKKTEIKSSQCEKLDLFSLGVVMYMLLYSKHPFGYKNSLSCNDYTQILETTEANCANENITETCKEFLKGLLEKDINKRLSYDQIVNHRWILGMKQKLESLYGALESDSEKMISEFNKEVMEDFYFEKFKSFEVNYDGNTEEKSDKQKEDLKMTKRKRKRHEKKASSS